MRVERGEQYFIEVLSRNSACRYKVYRRYDPCAPTGHDQTIISPSTDAHNRCNMLGYKIIQLVHRGSGTRPYAMGTMLSLRKIQIADVSYKKIGSYCIGNWEEMRYLVVR